MGSKKNKSNNKKNNSIKSPFDCAKSRAIIMAVLLVLVGLIFKADSPYVYKWYLMLLLLGLPALPFSHLFSKFTDKGYVFLKTLSMTFSAMLLFILSSFHIMKYTVLNCFISIIIVAAVVYGLSYFFNGKSIDKVTAFEKTDINTIFTEECVILAILIVMMYIRGYAPSAYGTEKFMDYGFMTSMMRTEYFPPEDFWYSGTNLNYYFLGQYFTTFLTKISFNKTEYTYNLMVMSICALTFVGVYSISSTLMKRRLSDANADGEEKVSPLLGKEATFAGILSAILVCFSGNFHYVLYKFIAPVINIFIRDSYDENYIGKNYWYPDATRYIGYHPETDDKTIHEFPCYSYVLNDLHAHVCNIILVVTLLAIVLAFAINNADRKGEKLSFKKLVNGTVLLVGFFLGVFQGSNFWDFPIYFVTAYAVIMFVNMRMYGINLLALIFTALQALISLILSKITIIAFSKDFQKMMAGIGIVENRSMLHQLIVLWGLPFIICIIGMVFTANDYRKGHADEVKKHINFDKFMHAISISDFVMFIIPCCAMGLILMPEVVYVKDIYSSGFLRSNTMFKLTFQAFIMFGICIGYYLIKMLSVNDTKRRKNTAIVFLIIVTGCSLYFFEAVSDSCGNVFKTENFKGINSLYFMRTEPVFTADNEVCEYINKNMKEQVRILEASGDSYTDYNRMSVVTGMPTIAGWQTHEWLWKNDYDALRARQEDVKTIYTSTNESEVSALVNRYGLDYIYIGELEYKKYEEMGSRVNSELLLSMYPVEYQTMPTADYPSSYLLKVR